MLLFSLVLTVVGAAGALGNLTQPSLRLLWGYTANAILLIYYAAPLSTILEVLRTKSSSTLHWPLVLMNTINGALWLAYGLAIHDYFIWVPNGVGVAVRRGGRERCWQECHSRSGPLNWLLLYSSAVQVGLFLLALILLYPRKGGKRSPTASEAGTASSTRQLTAAASDPDLQRATSEQPRPPPAAFTGIGIGE